MATSDIMQSKTAKFYLGLIILVFIGLVLTLLFNDTIILDELEHLRASWLVNTGEMPYRDFFEHHHPMIWFMFAPIMNILPHRIILVLYTAKSLAFLFSIGSSAILYLMMKRFMGGVFSGILCLVFFFFYFPSWYSFSLFKPDTFVRFFYLLGLFQFFIYCDKKQLKNLVFCGIAMTIAFCFLQTILFSILPLALPLGYLGYKNNKVFKDFLIASILPILIISAFAGWFYLNGTLLPYWQQNVIFNKYLFSIIHSESPRIFLLYSIEIICAIVAIGWVYYKHSASFYFNTITVLFGAEIIQHTIFPAIYSHYLVLLFMFSAMLIAYALNLQQSRKILPHLAIFLYINLFMSYAVLAITNNFASRQYLKEYDAHPESSIVNFDISYFNIYAPKYDYYWFYPSFEYIDNTLFNRRPDYDINQIIRTHKVDYIAYKKEVKPHFNWHNVPVATHAKDYWPQHKFDESILVDYEEILPDLYKRKEN